MKNERTLNILAADHSKQTREELKHYFDTRDDLKLINAVDNGQDAYQFILENEPDIVLLDVVLPVLDGFSVIEKINANNNIRKKPSFVILSSIAVLVCVPFPKRKSGLSSTLPPVTLSFKFWNIKLIAF